ncbi:MAG: hypothetical protein WCJ87_05195 [Burkholderiales bacterium]
MEMLDTMPTKGKMGRVFFTSQLIQIGLRSNRTGRTFKPAEISDTFWHELTHAILHDMEHPLCRNERFVSGFSERLNRAVNSARL